MAPYSVSIVAKNNVTMEVPLGVANQSKTIKNLIASRDESQQKKPILLTQFLASTLETEFEWCKANKGQSKFSMAHTFTNQYTRIEFTARQRDFFERHKLSTYSSKKDTSSLWNIVLAASNLDVPLLYFSVCYLLSRHLWIQREFEEKIPDGVADDLLCDILRFRSHAFLDEHKWSFNARLRGVLRNHAGILSLNHVDAAMKGSHDYRRTLRQLYGKWRSLLATSLSVYLCDEQCAVLEAFLSEATTRLRVKSLKVGGLPKESHDAFRTRMTLVKKLCDRFDFLDEVNLDLKCGAHLDFLIDDPGLVAFTSAALKFSLLSRGADSQKVLRVLSTLYPLGNRALSICFTRVSCDDRVLRKINKMFTERTELSPLVISSPVTPLGAQTFREVAAHLGFAAEGSSSHLQYSFKKERDDDWKMSISYEDNALSMNIKTMGQ